MKIAYYEKQGAARDVIQLGGMPQPQAQHGEVVVRVCASGVNPSDVKFRSGWNDLPLQFPRVVPHNDGAGEIIQVGEGVDKARIGTRVWIYEAQRGRAFGTAAEFVVVPEKNTVALPENASFEIGAALGVPAMTAHRCLFADGENSHGDIVGQAILITGGGGAVGNCAIQLAKWRGAIVIATASRPESLSAAREAGADEVINYKTEDVVARAREIAPRGIDHIVDVSFGDNIESSAKLIRNGGVVASYSTENNFAPTIPFRALMSKNATLQLVLVYTMSAAAHAAAARDINLALEAGALRPRIAARFSLDETAAAHEAVESGELVGKAIVLP